MRWLHSVVLLTAWIASIVANDVRVAIVLSWGTRSHVTPLFEGLRHFVTSNKQHQVTYVCSDFTVPFASEHRDVVQHVVNLGMKLNRSVFEDLTKAVSQIDQPIDTPVVLTNVLSAIAERYEESLVVYLDHFRTHAYDMIVCDFFERACMDAALESNTTYAISAPLGIFGIGTDWYIPEVLGPAPMDEWIASPWLRAQALWRALPLIIFSIAQESNMQRIRQGLRFQTSVDAFHHFQRHLMLSHNVIGLDPARALPTNIFVYGPIKSSLAAPLDSVMQQQLDAFIQQQIDVIYIAFGTAVALEFSPHVYDKLVASVDEMLSINPKVALLWSSKYHNHNLIDRMKQTFGSRFITSPWVNQQRVLQHAAVKVFITHGGYGSITEAMLSGTSLLVLPFFGDQLINANNAQAAGIAQQLDKYTFTSHEMTTKGLELIDAIRTPTSDLYQNVDRMQKIAQINSETSRIALSNMILLAATVGTDHLIPRAVDLNLLDRFPWWLVVGSALVLYSIKRLLGKCCCHHRDQRRVAKAKQT